MPPFLFSSFVLSLHGASSSWLYPTVPASIETARVYFSHMWTVDGKMNSLIPAMMRDDRGPGPLLMLTAADEDAAVNHFKIY